MNDRTRRWVIRGGLAVVVLIALAYGAIFIYANVINDAPDKFDSEDLTAAVNATVPPGSTDVPGTTAADPPATAAPPTAGDSTNPSTVAPSTTGAPTTAAPTTSSSAAFDGTWQVSPASQFGYRVEEVVAGVNTTAVGRGNEIEGTLTIDGSAATAGEFTVQVASITSDESRRDSQFRGSVMNTDQFPTATFALTQAIDLGNVPTPGEQVTATASGDLTLHGVTRSVSFEVTAEATARRIGVLGSIPVLFSDYDIPNPSNAVVKTEDNGLLEFILVFERAA